MSTYFHPPFMGSLQADPSCANGLAANYGQRFDHQVSSHLYCGPGAGGHNLVSQYGQGGSPGIHSLHDSRLPNNSISGGGHPDVNGFDHGGHISPQQQVGVSWGMTPGGPQPSPPSDFGHGSGLVSCVSENFNNQVSSQNGLHSCGSPSAGQGIPFYPWMGVVGKNEPSVY